MLVVDDEEDIREVLSNFLSEFGLDVDLARNGQNALECCEKGSYDYLVTDIKMPVMGGIELIEKLKDKPGIKPKMFIISGSVTESNYDDKAEGYLAKPFDPSDIYRLFSQ